MVGSIPTAGSARARTAIACSILLLAAVLWVVSADASRMDAYVLGLYRVRWFLCNVAFTYAALFLSLCLFVRADRAFLLRALLANGVLLAALTMLELPSAVGILDYTRVFGERSWYSPEHLSVRRMSFPNIVWEGAVLPDLAYKLGLGLDPMQVSLATDSHGLRNPREKVDPRVICAGDSMLVASLVPVDEILTERLQRRLGDEVMNISESTYCPQEAMLRVRHTVPDLKGRLVILFVFEGNDLSDSAEWQAWRARSGGTGWPRTGLIWSLVEQMSWANPAAAAPRAGVFVRPDGSRERVHFLYDGTQVTAGMGAFPELAVFFGDCARDLAKEGAAFAIAFLPMKIAVLHDYCEWPEQSALSHPRYWTSPFADAMSSVCEERGIPFLDTTAGLRQAAAEGRLVFFADDTHVNAQGHAVLADQLAPWIQQLLPR